MDIFIFKKYDCVLVGTEPPAQMPVAMVTICTALPWRTSSQIKLGALNREHSWKYWHLGELLLVENGCITWWETF